MESSSLEEESLTHFRHHVYTAWKSIMQKYGFTELTVSKASFGNPYLILLSNEKLDIIIEGINWGMNARIQLSLPTRKYNWFDLEQVLQHYNISAQPQSGTQDEQISQAAHQLENYCQDLLTGNTTVLEHIQIKHEEERKQKEEKKKQHELQLLSEGYTLIHTPWGDSIYQKPHSVVSDLQTYQRQYPEAVEVVFNASEIIDLPTPMKAVIYKWYKDIDNTIREGEPICEAETEKVAFDIVSTVSGKLIWLLPEGNIISHNTTVALVLPTGEK